MKIKSYDELSFTDDFLFSRIMRNPEIAKGVVENLLKIKVGRIEFLTSQFSIDEVIGGRGVRFDVYLKDSDKVLDIEMQTTIKKNEALRMRYYQSLMDIENLKKGQSYSQLKESYVVFLCLDDPIGDGLPVYEYVTEEKHTHKTLNDKMHKVLYNASCSQDAEDKNVRAFLKYLQSKTASDSLTKNIDSAVEESKNRQPWRGEYMLWQDQLREYKEEAQEEGRAEGRAAGLAEGRAEGRSQGLAEGRAEGRVAGLAEGRAEGERNKTFDLAKKMKAKGMAIKDIAEITGLSEEEIKEL